MSIDIGDEVRGQNVLLNDMVSYYNLLNIYISLSLTHSLSLYLQGTDFDSTGGLLSGTMKRLKGLAQGGHNNWMCYMILLIVFVFLILFYVIKWRQ